MNFKIFKKKKLRDLQPANRKTVYELVSTIDEMEELGDGSSQEPPKENHSNGEKTLKRKKYIPILSKSF